MYGHQHQCLKLSLIEFVRVFMVLLFFVICHNMWCPFGINLTYLQNMNQNENSLHYRYANNSGNTCITNRVTAIPDFWDIWNIRYLQIQEFAQQRHLVRHFCIHVLLRTYSYGNLSDPSTYFSKNLHYRITELFSMKALFSLIFPKRFLNLITTV